MKKALHFLSLIALIHTGSARQPYHAARQPQLKEFVIVEVTIGKERIFHKLKVPIVRDPTERRKPVGDQFGGGGWAFTGYCPKDIGCEYTLIATADGAGEDKLTVTATLSYKERKACDAQKEFTVVRGKPTELKAKCRASIKAYYDDNVSGTN